MRKVYTQEEAQGPKVTVAAGSFDPNSRKTMDGVPHWRVRPGTILVDSAQPQEHFRYHRTFPAMGPDTILFGKGRHGLRQTHGGEPERGASSAAARVHVVTDDGRLKAVDDHLLEVLRARVTSVRDPSVPEGSLLHTVHDKESFNAFLDTLQGHDGITPGQFHDLWELYKESITATPTEKRAVKLPVYTIGETIQTPYQGEGTVINVGPSGIRVKLADGSATIEVSRDDLLSAAQPLQII